MKKTYELVGQLKKLHAKQLMLTGNAEFFTVPVSDKLVEKNPQPI